MPCETGELVRLRKAAHLELRALASAPYEKLSKKLPLWSIPHRAGDAPRPAGDLYIAFETRLVPQVYETEAKGHLRVCKVRHGRRKIRDSLPTTAAVPPQRRHSTPMPP